MYPETKRTFEIPEGVFRGEYQGKSELYTQNSPLPDSHKKTVQNYDEYDQLLEEEMEIREDIDPEDGEIGYAPTINIDEEPVSEEEMLEEDDPLHPKRKVPLTPVSNDSGTLF